MKPKKILCVINSISAGGAEQMLQYIARYHQRNRIALEICVLHKTGKESALIPRDVPVHYLHAGGAGSYPAVLMKMLLLIFHHKYSLLFSVLAKSNVITAIVGWITNTPVVMSECGPTHMYIEDYSFPRLARMIMSPAYASARAIVAVSRAGKDSIISIFPRCKNMVEVVHCGVDIDGVRAKAAEPQSLMAAPYLVSCGRLSPEKNYPLLIEAAAALRDKYHMDYPLCITGKGPEHGALAALARQKNVRLTLPGFVDNPYSIMAGAGVFVLTSRYESFPMIILEAMVCGVPIVSVDCAGGIREVLRDGENCLIAATAAPEDIARALSRLLTDKALACRLTAAAADDVRRSFSVQQMVGQYEDILTKEFLEINIVANRGKA